MSAAAFRVQGELVLESDGFVGSANASKTALDGLSAAGRKLVDTSAAVNQATAREIQAQTAVTAARREAAAVAEQSGQRIVAANVAVNTAAVQAAQAQVSAASAAKTQADGFARLAQQQAVDTGKARSRELMESVEASNQQLKALYGTAAKTQTAELEKAAGATRTYEGAQERVRAANDNVTGSVDRQSKALAYQRVQLGYQLNDVFVQLASGQGVVRTAIQQGPQITQLYGGLGATLRAIPLAAAGYVTGIAAVAGITLAAVNHLNEFNSRGKATENMLQATGRAAQVSAGQIEAVVQAQARRPGADVTETGDVARSLLANSALTGDSVQRTLALARDLARVTGTDLPAAAAALMQGLDGTEAGARKLDAVFNALTPRELEQVRRLEALGDRAGAVGVVLGALERNLAGAAERGASPLDTATTKLRTAWNSLLGALSNTGVITFAAGVMRQLALPVLATADAINVISRFGGGSSSPGGNAPDQKDIDSARKSVDYERSILRQLQEDKRKAHADDQWQYDQAILASQRRLKDGEASLSQLEGRAGQVTNKAVTDQIKGWATALNIQVKESLAAIDKIDTVVGQRQALQDLRTRAATVINSGVATPDQVAQASEALAQIDGKLRALRTPAEELKRQLDLGTALSLIPAHLRPAAEAFKETQRRALEMGMSTADALRMAEQARDNVLREQSTASGQQLQLLSAEAEGALKVAEAYGTSRAAALQAAAAQKAAAAELQGSIASGTAGEFAQRQLEQDAANAVVASAEKNEAYAREVAGLERLVAAEGQSSVAARETERANRVAAYAEDLRAQAAASGSAIIIAAAERQIATYDRLSKKAMEAEIRRDANALNRQYDPTIAYDQEIAKLGELQSTGLLTQRTIEEATRAAEQRRLEASRSATDGMIAGLRRYADEATNAGSAAADGMATGLRSIEDNLVQLATTGQFTFANMVNSMIADLARLTARQTITGPLAKAIGGINWGSIFSGGGSGSVPDIGTGTGYTYHTGGLIGPSGSRSRQVPRSTWIDAPRYHTGGLVGGERAIIAQDNEEVLTTSDPRHRWNFGRGLGSGATAVSVNVDVSVINNTNSQVSTEQGAGSDGTPWMKIFVDEVKNQIAGDITGTRGAVYRSIKGTFGVGAVART
jgi:lambda family phage tail tape measure protein